MSKLTGTFPVLFQGSRDYVARLIALECPRLVPWAFIEQFRKACEANHGQTPERLAERGGLDPAEIVAVVEGSSNWAARKRCRDLSPDESVPKLKALLAAFASESPETTERK